MTMETIFMVLPTALLVYLFIKNRKVIKDTYGKLTIVQLIGVIIAYIITIFIVFILIYYVGNWLVGYITFKPLNAILKVVIVVVVLYTALNLLNKSLKKITNGVL